MPKSHPLAARPSSCSLRFAILYPLSQRYGVIRKAFFLKKAYTTKVSQVKKNNFLKSISSFDQPSLAEKVIKNYTLTNATIVLRFCKDPRDLKKRQICHPT
jgi:hypothetical protein